MTEYKPLVVGTYPYMCEEFGKDKVEFWLENAKMESLFKCMEVFSNNSFVNYGIHHRDKELNILEAILQGQLNALYPSVTYGTRPNETCTNYIGELTGRKNRNCEIAKFLIENKKDELKEWLLTNYHFSEDDKRLLHYDFEDD